MKITTVISTLNTIKLECGDVDVFLSNNILFCLNRKIHAEVNCIARIEDQMGPFVLMGDAYTGHKLHNRITSETNR